MDLEILEALALSDDRSAALQHLLPGSEDHDYYRALHAQHRGALAEVDQLLESWPQRHGHTERFARLRLRQLLVRTATAHTPGATDAANTAADQLRDQLGVQHGHEAEVEDHDASRARPTRLADGAFDPQALLREAIEQDGHLSQVTDEGLDELVAWRLDAARRRALLNRLGHTAQPQLVQLVADDLALRDSGGFGARHTHHELTLAQLDALVALRPELAAHAGWVEAVVTRMRPPAGVDLELDLAARAAYLEALWLRVAELPPASNSLKAHVLWHLLDTTRRRGAAITPERFRAYLALPRQASHLARGRLDKIDRAELAQLDADFTRVTGLGPAGDDEALVRAVLGDQLALAESYAPWLDRAWLDAELATARLLAGSPDADRDARVLGPARAAALRDRVELAWSVDNPTRFAADAPVALALDVKHVAELVIKVFRIDPVAYFQLHRREVDTTLDLDGLAASHEEVLRFSEPALRRVRRALALPACARPGTYVIDLIGNGISSRAVVHKGRLRHVMRIAGAGHVVTIFDDADQPRPDARAWIGDRAYVPDEHGRIVVPFSTQPGRTPMLLVAGEVTTVAQLDLVAEHAELALALTLDRESLTAGRTARAIARLTLSIGGARASLGLLQRTTWDLTRIDRQGVATTKSQPLVLDDTEAAVLEWPLGDDTAELTLAIRGVLEIRSEQRERELVVTRTCQVATMHAGPSTEALYLAHTAAGWVVSALGKTGEPRAHRAVTIGLVHRWATVQASVELATDERGRIELGALPGARWILATLGGASQTWDLDDARAHAPAIHAVVGRDVLVHLPASRPATDVLRRASLVELRAGRPARHVELHGESTPGATPDAPGVGASALASAIALTRLPAGDYQLRIPGLPATLIVITAPTATLDGWAITPTVLVGVPRQAPAIAALTIHAPGTAAVSDPGSIHGQLTVQLRGARAHTRIHVIATRFASALTEPPIHALPALPAVAPAPGLVRRGDRAPGARYVSGRELGDEYRYILERRTQPRYPGLLLDKPSLLLNPWARRTTTTEVATARPGTAYGAPAPIMAQSFGESAERGMAGPDTDDAYVGYDFLAAPPIVLANLVADAEGRLELALDALGDATSVTVIVDDPAGVTLRRIERPEPALAVRDLRLHLALDPARHAAQHKAIVPLVAGARLVIEDLATAQVHLIDSVERAHAYLLSLRDDPALRELAFVTRWHALDDAERRALYSKHACHELHLFLYFKDRAFFDAVIRPYLAHKRTPTFLDHWLLDADVTPYLEPARLLRLNAVERALLAWRLPAEPALPRMLADELATQPPDPVRDARLIDALLGSATLDGDDAVGDAKEEAMTMAMDVGGRGGGGVAMRASMMAAPAPAPKSRAMPSRPRGAAKKAAKRDADDGGDDDGFADLAEDRAPREQAPLFRAADRTQEWAEHNWWRRTPAQSGPEMIRVHRLWRDLAHHTGGPFLSPALGLAADSFAEAMCALAVTDLPFVAPAHAIVPEGPRLTIDSAGPALAGTSQIVDSALVTGGAPLVVGTSYVRADDRHDWSSGEQVDKYVDGPLVAGVVYTCLVVLANPTSSRQRVSALIQIPRGSMPVAGARPTYTIDVLLEPYGTHGHEYSFYVPVAGTWTHFPVHVSRGGQIVAAAPARLLEVTAGAAASDPGSWSHVSQRAPLAEVVAYLATANLAALDLTRVAWRLREPSAYAAILGALEARRAYDPTLWGYALRHRDWPRVRAWLRARGADLLAAGPALDMLGLDAEDLGGYEHLELAPLINARAHRLGPRLRVLNDGLAAQYRRFLELVAHRPAPTAPDVLAAVHYLLAQDRIADAVAQLARIDPPPGSPPGSPVARLQLDYVTGYAACLRGDLAAARAISERWRDHPVDRWRHRFTALAAMLDELAGAAPVVVDPRSREQQQAELAARQPAFELAVDRDGVIVRSQHVAALELRFFEMDIELLFSRQPFVQSDVSRFSFIEPGHRETLTAPGREQRLAWPPALRGKNVVVEAVGAGMRKAQVHYANDLALQLVHAYGQLRVQRASDGGALAATYVKVYARKRGGQVAFYKDGYTDLRGWFDYASLSTTELDAVERFAILVCSDHTGAAILEAGPPAR